MAATILYADADPVAAALVERILADVGLGMKRASDGAGLEHEASAGSVDVLVVDAALPGLAEGWLVTVLRRWPDLPVIVVSEAATEEDSARVIRDGAAGFLGKPFTPAELLHAVSKGISSAEASAEAPPPSVLSSPSTQPSPGTLIVGDSAALREVQGFIGRAASSQATVLVRGESGTGKELIARRIHELGGRSRGPFVKVHCAALPEALLESELFGYEKGAFTGATSRKPGRVEIAEGGTLFLDEIGDISAAIQVKLLRVLQDKEYERVGGNHTLRADVRFIAATHRPLEEMIRRGEFREDLYYRLNVIAIVSPPLRTRPDDIEVLAQHFCRTFGAQYGRPRLAISREAVGLLRGCPWPGNVRQLQNFLERLVVFSESDEIGVSAVRAELASQPVMPDAHRSGPVDFTTSVLELDEAVRRAERRALEKALGKAGGNRTVAARILGVSRRTLYNKLAEHGLA